MDVFTFDVATAARLKNALGRVWWSEQDVNLLAESPDLALIRDFLHGRAAIVPYPETDEQRHHRSPITFKFDVALATKLKKALHKANWSEQDLNLLIESPELRWIRARLHKRAALFALPHTLIACEVLPPTRHGFTVQEHLGGGFITWNRGVQAHALYLSSCQQGREFIKGYDLYDELREKGVPVLSASVLEYLVRHPDLIPDSWKGFYVFFWGTIFTSKDFWSEPRECVRYLHWSWSGNRWETDYRYLNSAFTCFNPAAVRPPEP